MTDQNTPSAPPPSSNSVIPFPGAAARARKADMHNSDYETPGGMPNNFSLGSDGIYQLRSAVDEDQISVRICSPLIVEALCRTSSGEKWGYVVSVQDPDSHWHQVVLDASDIQKKSAASLNTLFESGLQLSSADKAAASLFELLAGWRPDARYQRINRLGWTGKNFTSFALGSGRVLGEPKVVVDALSDDVAGAMLEAGAIEGWRTEVAKLCEGNPLMILSLSHAFSGPLLSVLGRDGGGFHLRGVSSRGKSTLLGVAASVWGAPSFVQSWRGTDNGIEGIAAACNDSLLVLDELHQVEPRVVGQIVYMLANGRGRLRANSNGRTEGTRRWIVPVLSSGEISLEEHMASGGRRMHAGQDIRLIDLVADARPHGAFDVLHGEPDGKAFAERLKAASGSNYGTAGMEFVQKLMCNIDKQEVMQRHIDDFCGSCATKTDLPSDGQVQRVLTRFGIAALAGEMATKFGLTGWKPGVANAAAEKLFIEWFEARDGSTRREIDDVGRRIHDYLSKNSTEIADVGAQDVNPHDGWKDDDWFYILPESWKRIHGANDPVEAARLLHAAGHMKTQNGKGLQFKMGRETPNRPRVYAVRATTIEAAANS